MANASFLLDATLAQPREYGGDHAFFLQSRYQPNPIAKAEAEAKANGITLGKLNDSNPTKHALASELLPDIYGAEPRGQRYAREALAAFLHEQGNTATADDLYILSSTSEAYSWLIKLLCNAGDAVLAPKPGYPLIESIARLECVDMIEYQQRFDGSWYIDVAELREALEGEDGGRIRALVLINPNNPTGSYVKASEREAIVRLCHDHEVAIIADEVFYDYDLEPFDGNARLAGETGTLTFALDGFSKTLAAPHAKVGWIQVSGPAAEVDEAKRRLDVVADDYLPMSEIIAKQIPAMLGAAAAQTARVRERVQTNLAALHTMLDDDEQGMVSVLRAEGGWNVLLRVPSVLDENELVLSMIEKHGISGQPGYFFDMTSNGYLAISLLPEPDEFRHNVQTVLDTVNTMIG